MSAAVHTGKQLLAALGIDPVYVVTTTDAFRQLGELEHNFVFGHTESTLAFTAPVADLMFSKGYLKYEWRGRGFCCVFRRSPLTLGSTATLGVMVHEAGHYVADCNRPERDDPDFDRAGKVFWASLRTDAEMHNHRWLRATVHLWHRACRLGYEIPFSNVLKLEQYGYSRQDFAPLLDEVSQREGESIESILGTGVAISQASPIAAQPQLKSTRWPKIQLMAGGPMLLHSDGSVETPPTLSGRRGERFPSVAAYVQSIRERELVA